MTEETDDSGMRDLAMAISAFGKELLCPICLSIYSNPVRLSCCHYFCKECLEEVLKEKSLCPICKTSQVKRSYEESASLQEIINNYRILATFDDSPSFLSQPLSPDKQLRTMLGITEDRSLISPTKERIKEMTFSLQTKRNEYLRRERNSYVWLVTGLEASERRLLSHVCNHSSIRLVHEYSQEVTHCITTAFEKKRGAYITKRTMKYLIAMLHHVPVVSIHWVQEIAIVIDSILNQHKEELQSEYITKTVSFEYFPTFENFMIRGDEQVRKLIGGGPLRAWKSKRGLFSGLSFVVIGEFTIPLPSREFVIEIIEHGEGIINEDEECLSLIVIVDKNGDGIISNPLSKNVCVSYIWLLDCISNYQIVSFSDYLCIL